MKSKDSIDEVEQKRKEAAINDYTSYLQKVQQMKTMTDTSAWKELFRGWQRDKLETQHQILVEEKTRDMIVCQERIKAIDRLVIAVELPVIDLQSFCNDLPLFAGEFKTRAAFNKDTGTIELRTVK